jgi:dipeptidyl aminopeptidase/acylaminoacyl peptidase
MGRVLRPVLVLGALLAVGACVGAYVASSGGDGHGASVQRGITAGPTAIATPTPGTEIAPLYFDVSSRTLHTVGNGEALFYTVPLHGGELLIVNVSSRKWEIIQLDGEVVQSLPLGFPATYPTPSPDGQLLAYSEDRTLRVHDRGSGTDRVIDRRAEVASGQLTWSPDGTQIAVAFREGDAARLDVIDLASGGTTEVFSSGVTPAYVAISKWRQPHEISFRVYEGADFRPGCCPPTGSGGCCPLQGGEAFSVSDDGTRLTDYDGSNPLWRACGPRCGLPPAGYESADGTVEWCISAAPSCTIGYVDRVAGEVRLIAQESEISDYALSPDGALLAMVLRDAGGGQRLRLVNVADWASEEYALPYVHEGHGVRWFPDGKTLVLYFPGT